MIPIDKKNLYNKINTQLNRLPFDNLNKDKLLIEKDKKNNMKYLFHTRC